MVKGTTFVGMKPIFRVEIEGRGGDSVHTAYFDSFEDCVFASALDGKDREPEQVQAMEFSDGSLLLHPTYVTLSKGPTYGERLKVLETLTPAQRLMFQQK